MRRGAVRPWPAVVLGIDPGKTSGAAILERGQLVGVWQVKKAEAAEAVVAELKMLGEALAVDLGTKHLPVAIVMETWAGKMRRGTVTAAGLGKAAGKWETILELAGISLRRIVRVNPSTWHARVIGGRKTSDKERIVKAMRHRFPELRDAPGFDHNCAEALAMAVWGSRAAEVGDVLPKRVREHG